MIPPALEFRGIEKTYPDGTRAVRGLDLRIESGSFTVFVGPSGCGKTTSMRMINRMVEPSAGRYLAWADNTLAGPIEVMVTPNQVQFLTGIADNLLRRVLIGRKHVQKVPQWFGETVGFWNGSTLVAWTANVQGWTISHSMFEFSNELQVIEVIRPAEDGSGLVVEATFYDPEAFR